MNTSIGFSFPEMTTTAVTRRYSRPALGRWGPGRRHRITPERPVAVTVARPSARLGTPVGLTSATPVAVADEEPQWRHAFEVAQEAARKEAEEQEG